MVIIQWQNNTTTKLMENKTDNNDMGTLILLAEAKRIKDKYGIELNAYFDFIDLLRDAYLKGYYEGAEMVKKVYGINNK